MSWAYETVTGSATGQAQFCQRLSHVLHDPVVVYKFTLSWPKLAATATTLDLDGDSHNYGNENVGRVQVKRATPTLNGRSTSTLTLKSTTRYVAGGISQTARHQGCHETSGFCPTHVQWEPLT